MPIDFQDSVHSVPYVSLLERAEHPPMQMQERFTASGGTVSSKALGKPFEKHQHSAVAEGPTHVGAYSLWTAAKRAWLTLRIV